MEPVQPPPPGLALFQAYMRSYIPGFPLMYQQLPVASPYIGLYPSVFNSLPPLQLPYQQSLQLPFQ